jgi:serine/threonine-protein phosphatase 2A activator
MEQTKFPSTTFPKSQQQSPSSMATAFPKSQQTPTNFSEEATFSKPFPVSKMKDDVSSNDPQVSSTELLPSVGQCEFVVPQKKIHAAEEFEFWKHSKVKKAYLQFILELNESVKYKKISDECVFSENVKKSLHLLDQLEVWINETPPLENKESRYGNKAFRTWFTIVEKELDGLMKQILPAALQEAAKEVGPYFLHSFGNYTRIDYGTGHEASFVMWIWALYRLGIFTNEDRTALVTKLFVRYILLVRKIQKTYLLEPAGSRGVWGLDDYQHLSYLFGASQLIDHKNIKPKSIHNNDILEEFGSDYLYLSCIQFTKQMKTGPFGEHSPTLDSISHVPHQLWWKVNNGLIEMYKQEVLDKFVIVQHFLFGTIIPFQ